MKSSILFDGNCIVCDLEVSHYRRIALDLFEMVDISDPAFRASDHGLTTEAVNLHLHVKTPEGEILRGVPAFAHIWSRIPRYRWASRVVSLPIVRQVAWAGYEVFVRVRPWLPKRQGD